MLGQLWPSSGLFRALAFESHLSRQMPQRRTGENRIATEFEESPRASCEFTLDPFAPDPSKHPRDRLLQHRHVLREQNESERKHPQPKHRQNAENAPGDQQDSNRNANQAGRWLAQPSNELCSTRTSLSFNYSHLLLNFLS